MKPRQSGRYGETFRDSWLANPPPSTLSPGKKQDVFRRKPGLTLDWPDKDWQWHTHLKLSSRFTVCEPHRNPARSQKYLKTKPVEIWPVSTDLIVPPAKSSRQLVDTLTTRRSWLRSANIYLFFSVKKSIVVCKQISFFFCEKFNCDLKTIFFRP